MSFVQLREAADDGHTFGQDSLVALDLGAETTTELLRFSDSLLAFDWNEEGTVVAYLLRTQTPTIIGPHLLCSLDTRTAKISLLRQIENPFGTSVGQRDETVVSWAPSGDAVLVTDTAARPSLFIVMINGQDAVQPRNGTLGRWLSDTQVLFQEDPGDASAPWTWLLLSPTTGESRAFGLPVDAYRPALSPSRTVIAFDDGDIERPGVYTFVTETGALRHLADGYVAPIWIGPQTIAITAVEPCTGEFCDIPWSSLGEVVAIDTETGHSRPLSLPTTLNDVVRYGPIDVLVP